MIENASLSCRRSAGPGRGRLALVALAVFLAFSGAAWLWQPALAQAQTEGRSVEPPPLTGGAVPGASQGSTSDAEIWRAIRRGIQGEVSIPDERAGIMIQSEGDNWRTVRNGPLSVIGAWIVLGFIAVVALFFALRGRIRIDSGRSGVTVERFNTLERATHWLTAVPFIVLGLTGLNMLYGKYLLLPLLGPALFADLTRVGKFAHNYLAFAFMVGVVLIFVLWVRHNLPSLLDFKWLLVGGGLFKRGVHPPARKFNAGQKLVFWAVILGGVSLGLSGIALLFPFQFSFFDDTFRALNALGLELPIGLTPLQEMQLNQLWHGVIGLVMIGIIIGHIYIGSLGMEGAFAAMGSGQVDENWAREHHSIWLAEKQGRPRAGHEAAHAAE